MKKTLGILTLVLALSTPAWAIDCEDGILITGKNGREYCQSRISMTWWSAFSWCEGHGLTPISLNDCDYNGETFQNSDKCPNFEGVSEESSGWAWTTTLLYGRTDAQRVIHPKTGKLDWWERTHFVTALCK